MLTRPSHKYLMMEQKKNHKSGSRMQRFCFSLFSIFRCRECFEFEFQRENVSRKWMKCKIKYKQLYLKRFTIN